MAFPTSTCSCGVEFSRVNKLRKSCSVCQVVRDMTYRPNLKKNCAECGEEFFPIRTSYKTCPECALHFPQPDKYPACSHCKQHYRSAPGLMSTCVYCVMRSPEARRAYVQTLTRLLKARALALREHRDPPLTWGEAKETMNA